MTAEPERITKLQSYGLTENQAKAYLALLELGRATASALNKVSGVPRNKVYSVVEELNEKGLVDIVLEDPIVFEPRPIGRYLDMLVNELDSKKNNLSHHKKDLETEFQIRRILAEEDLQGGSFRIFKGRRGILQQHSRMNRECKRTMRILCSPSSAARTLASGSLSEYQSGEDGRPIHIEMYSPLTKDNLSAVETLHERLGETVRVSYGLPENLVIKVGDEHEVMFTHFIPDSDSVTSGDDIGVWTDNPVFLKLAMELLRNAAARSLTFESAKTMLEKDQRPPRFDIVQEPAELRRIVVQCLTQGRTVDVVVPAVDLQIGVAQLTDDERERIRKSADRIRILTDATPEQLAEIGIGTTSEIRQMSPLPARFAIFDRRVVRAYNVDPGDVSPLEDLGNLSIVTNLPSAVAEARDHFERLWNEAEAIAVHPRKVKAREEDTAEAEANGIARVRS